MTDVKPEPPQIAPTASASRSDTADDSLAHLHKMSTTAGVGTTEYVAINPVAVAAVFLGLASALALMDEILLAFPVAAIMCGIIALVQIGRSGGTQTGRAIATIGIVLALLFAGLVGGRAIAQQSRNRADEQQIDGVIKKLSDAITAGDYDAAYALFGERFQQRVTKPQFVNVITAVHEGRYYGKVNSIHSNGRMEFQVSETSGELFARTMLVLDLANNNQDRQETLFRKKPDGTWVIDGGLDVFFPAAAPPKRQ